MGYDTPHALPTLEAVRQRGQAAIRTVGRLARLQPASEPGPGLAADLRQVLALMEAGFGAQVFHLTMDGFDTHSGQRQTHDQLMAALGDALARV